MRFGTVDWLTWLIAGVWLINGLYCKLLNGVPRHRLIVARILGDAHAAPLTRLIGAAELGMAIWIMSGFLPGLAVITQVIVIAVMNAIEFFKSPDLLLFGRVNAIFALLLCIVICWNGYYFHPLTPLH